MFAPETSYVINLARRKDRLHRFYCDFPGCLPAPERFEAVNGQSAAPFTCMNRAAWGCLQSHLGVFRAAMDAGADSVLVFEDDAVADQNCCLLLQQFSEDIPDDWQFVYLGAAPMHALAMPMIKTGVYMPRTCRATHAYAVRQPMLGTIYQIIIDSGYSSHIDHWYEGFFGRDGRPGYYCPAKWIFHQRGGYSDISGKVHDGLMRWTDPQDTRSAKQVKRIQSCDQDATGRCRRKRCGRVHANECAIGTGIMLVAQ